MFGYQIAFNQPWYLVLLLLLPVLWAFSFRSLAGLGPVRRIFALALRSLVFALIICCLAEVQWQKSSDRLTVFYLLDQSESIPRPVRRRGSADAPAEVGGQRGRGSAGRHHLRPRSPD